METKVLLFIPDISSFTEFVTNISAAAGITINKSIDRGINISPAT